MKELKVCLSCLSIKRLSKDTVQSINKLKEHGLSFEMFVKEASNLEYVKNDFVNDMMYDTVEQQIFDEYNYILFIEDGVVFTADHVKELMSRNVPVIAAVKKNRLSQNFYDCGFFETDAKDDISRILFFDSLRGTNTIHQVDWVNSPLLLVKHSIFNDVSYPWFEGFSMTLYDDDANAHKKCVGENIGFCYKLIKKNIPVFVDLNCEVGYE